MVLYFQVRRDSQLLAQGEIEPPFELGRQNKQELDLTPVCISDRSSVRRLIFLSIAADLSIPRTAAIVHGGQPGTSEFTIENLLKRENNCDVKLSTGKVIRAGERLRVRNECTLTFSSGFSVRLCAHASALEDKPANVMEDSGESFRSLAQMATMVLTTDSGRSILDLPQSAQSEAVDLIRKALRSSSEVPGTAAFYAAIVNSVKEMIDVDRVIVLEGGPEEWVEKASTQRGDSGGLIKESLSGTVRAPVAYSRSLVRRVVASKQTEIVEPNIDGLNMAGSMTFLQRAVASPIFDEQRNVVAILYADKRSGTGIDRPISLLQASLLDVIASSASMGLMRQRDADFRVKTGQFFSKSVLDRLSNQQDLLEGRDAEVSILSCDIRGFSAITHRVGAAETIKWINDVLTSLSECVLEEDGVVVDYVGDALLAMFGAPETQLDHADRACRAACAMLRLVPELNERHQTLAEGKFGIGIGVSTGPARVGNTGSRIKYKYGPLGNTVNMACRVEGITKQIGTPGLMTGSTCQALSTRVLSRRLTLVNVVGIPEPVELYEIQPDDTESNRNLCQQYEAALEAFEQQRTADAIAQLATIVKEWPNDVPSQLLLKRTAACLSQAEPFDRVWRLSQK